jgi:hypothetical protein
VLVAVVAIAATSCLETTPAYLDKPSIEFSTHWEEEFNFHGSFDGGKFDLTTTASLVPMDVEPESAPVKGVVEDHKEQISQAVHDYRGVVEKEGSEANIDYGASVNDEDIHVSEYDQSEQSVPALQHNHNGVYIVAALLVLFILVVQRFFRHRPKAELNDNGKVLAVCDLPVAVSKRSRRLNIRGCNHVDTKADYTSTKVVHIPAVRHRRRWPSGSLVAVAPPVDTDRENCMVNSAADLAARKRRSRVSSPRPKSMAMYLATDGSPYPFNSPRLREKAEAVAARLAVDTADREKEAWKHREARGGG